MCAGWRRQKYPVLRQHRLKRPPGTAGTRIVSSQLFQQFFVAVHEPMAAFDLGFGRETFAALTRDLENTPDFRCEFFS
jgi:hypothetical protein